MTGSTVPASLDEAVEALLHFSPKRRGGHDAVAATQSLLAELGNPQDRLRVVHVAGTSGKTSVATQIRDLLLAAGRRPGLTVSPHIDAFNERVQVGDGPLEEKAFLRYVGDVLEAATRAGLQPTYFELVIALAFHAFAAEGVDYAVVEVGIGGLGDATNVRVGRPKWCAISAIGFDHTEILGHTVPEIARHKAGIIAPGSRAYVIEQAPEVLDMVRDRAAEVGAASLSVVTPVAGLSGYRAANAALARELVRGIAAHDGFAPPSAAAEQTAAEATPIGRHEVFEISGHRVVIDGAHNPQKLVGLVEALRAEGVERAAVLATLTQAPLEKLRASLAPLVGLASWLVVPDYEIGGDGKVKRSYARADVVATATALGIQAVAADSVSGAVEALFARGERDLVVTGSLYLASLVRPYLLHRASSSAG